jgi:pimeloyl-ACP methyl ester carboxylesterase
MRSIKYAVGVMAIGAAFQVAALGAHAAKSDSVIGGPLNLKDEGSFFVGGELVTTNYTGGAGPGSYMRRQAYVNYKIPAKLNHPYPIVFLHGGGLTGATWETTPDGREGWDTYFARQGFATYMVDMPGRGRAGFDPEPINHGVADQNISLVPSIQRFTRERAWTFFRIGPTVGTPYPGTQFPLEAGDQLSAQGVPYAEVLFAGGGQGTTPPAMAALLDRIGPAIIISHSLGGPQTDATVGLRPNLIKGVINIEAVQTPVPTDAIVTAYTNFPDLELFGDNVLGNPVSTGQPRYDARTLLANRINAAGGSAKVVLLPDVGFTGNTHMLMQEKNNLQIADWLIDWIRDNVEKPKGGKKK